MDESAEKSPEETRLTAEGAEEQKKKEQQQQGEVGGEEEGGGEKEGEGESESKTSIFQSPLRLVRKTKMKLTACHVTLLEGTDFSCEVEVRRGSAG